MDAHPLTSFEARRAAREDMLSAIERLIVQFPALPAGVVIRCAARAREELLRSGMRAGLVPAVVSLATRRLNALSPAHAGLPATV